MIAVLMRRDTFKMHTVEAPTLALGFKQLGLKMCQATVVEMWQGERCLFHTNEEGRVVTGAREDAVPPTPTVVRQPRLRLVA